MAYAARAPPPSICPSICAVTSGSASQHRQQHPTPPRLNPYCDADQIPRCRLTTAGQSMATAGQLRARQLPIVEVVVTATSNSTKSSKPLSLPLFSSRLPSALSNPATGPAATAWIPPSTELVRRRRTVARARNRSDSPTVVTPARRPCCSSPTSKSGGREQDSSIRPIFGRTSVGGGSRTV